MKILVLQDLLIKVVTETVENEIKEQKRGFLSMLAATLGASLLKNALTGKDALRTGEGRIRSSQGF